MRVRDRGSKRGGVVDGFRGIASNDLPKMRGSVSLMAQRCLGGFKGSHAKTSNLIQNIFGLVP